MRPVMCAYLSKIRNPPRFESLWHHFWELEVTGTRRAGRGNIVSTLGVHVRDPLEAQILVI